MHCAISHLKDAQTITHRAGVATKVNVNADVELVNSRFTASNRSKFVCLCHNRLRVWLILATVIGHAFVINNDLTGEFKSAFKLSAVGLYQTSALDSVLPI
jgi:hypothetical protein